MMRFVAGLERGFYLAHFSVAACPYATYYRDFFRAFFVEHALPDYGRAQRQSSNQLQSITTI